jgi:hypothetical protein
MPNRVSRRARVVTNAHRTVTDRHLAVRTHERRVTNHAPYDERATRAVSGRAPCDQMTLWGTLPEPTSADTDPF